MKVLIIEDEMIIAVDLESYLEQSGIKCAGICGNLIEVNDLMANDVNVVFMDLTLKDNENGYDIAELLRKNFKFYLIFVSASTNTEIVKRSDAFKNSEFIKKPYDFSRIKQALENAQKFIEKNSKQLKTQLKAH